LDSTIFGLHTQGPGGLDHGALPPVNWSGDEKLMVIYITEMTHFDVR